MKGFGKALVATSAAGAVLVAALLIGGAVFAQEGSGSGGSAADGEHGPAGRVHRLMGTVHMDATFTYVDGSSRTFANDFGRVTEVDGSNVTIERRDGEPVTATATEETCVLEYGEETTLDDLEAGQSAMLTQEDGSLVAVRAGPPGPPRGPRGEGQGPTERPCPLLADAYHGDITVTFLDGTTEEVDWDRGRITAIGDGEVTFEQPNGETVTLSYDDDTHVRDEGHEGSIDDLAVGDRAMFISEDGVAKLIRCITGPGDGSGPNAETEATASL